MDIDILTIIKNLLQARDINFVIWIFIMFVIIVIVTKDCKIGVHAVKKIILMCIIAGLVCKMYAASRIKNMPPKVQTQIMQELQQKLPFGRLL